MNNLDRDIMKPLTILDGGMGRELQEIGAPFSQPLWSAQALIESPDYVRKAHQNFIDAGAQIIIANSYACVPFHLGEARYQKEGAILARQAAEIAASVATSTGNGRVQVAGAIPPPLGSYRPDLFEEHKARSIIQTLFDAQAPYVDMWIVETISSLKEFEITHSILKTSDKTTFYAFSLDDTTTTVASLRSGDTVTEAIMLACRNNVQGIMFNCSVPEVMEQAIQDANQVIANQIANSNAPYEMTIGVYANNFMPIVSGHEANGTLQSMRELSPDDYLIYAKRWHELGASIIGGCCGIGPKHIKALSQWQGSLTE